MICCFLVNVTAERGAAGIVLGGCAQGKESCDAIRLPVMVVVLTVLFGRSPHVHTSGLTWTPHFPMHGQEREYARQLLLSAQGWQWPRRVEQRQQRGQA